MKTALVVEYGNLQKIKIQEVPIPTPKENQILVKVHAAALNPFDSFVQQGFIKNLTPPFTLGGDFAGILADTGQEVYGTANVVNGGSGSLAEYTVVAKDRVAKKPEQLNFRESASLVLVGASAIQALTEHVNVQKGQKILILGGSGGIGSVAIQLAKHLGAYVVTTVSTGAVDQVKKLGADQIIDYTKNEFHTTLSSDFDAVYDTVGKNTNEAFLVIKPGGVLVSMKGPPDEILAKKYSVRAVGQNTGTNTVRLEKLAEFVKSGAIKPVIDSVFSLEKTQEAFQKLATGHPQGKIVVDING